VNDRTEPSAPRERSASSKVPRWVRRLARRARSDSRRDEETAFARRIHGAQAQEFDLGSVEHDSPGGRHSSDDELDLAGLIAVGETPELSAQDVVDEIHSAAEIEAGVTGDLEYGRIGRPFDKRSPFFVGLLGGLGLAVAVAISWTFVALAGILLLLVFSLFIAVGLDPVVAWLHRHGLARWAAVSVVLLVALGALVGFFALAIPVVVSETGRLSSSIPHYLHSLRNHSTTLGKLSARFHIAASLQRLLKGGGSSAVFGGIAGLGGAVLTFLGSIVLIVPVSIYLLVDLPRVKRGIYQLAPRSRRARMVLLTDELANRVGGYMLGNVLTSLVAAVLTYAQALIFGIPFALFLALLVAVLDLIPVIGSTIGGILVTLVALTVSPTVAVATGIFYVIYRVWEDYMLTPRIMSRTVDVPGLVTVVATVLGGALFGIIGALIAIPVAAGMKLMFEEISQPRLDRA
jgi:predicted PurR-regulated permease PerM